MILSKSIKGLISFEFFDHKVDFEVTVDFGMYGVLNSTEIIVTDVDDQLKTDGKTVQIGEKTYTASELFEILTNGSDETRDKKIDELFYYEPFHIERDMIDIIEEYTSIYNVKKDST